MSDIQNSIVIQGIRTHNLKNIDIELPKNKIITITGVSGSGKSSLAFDTIYKEGQFRYVESLSSYLRQFFNLGSRPEIDYTSGLSPAIAIEQNKRVGNARSTVGTMTEIDDYLRLLFSKLGDIYCYGCEAPIKASTSEQIISDIRKDFLGEKIYILQDLIDFDDDKNLKKFVRNNRKKVESGNGFIRYMLVSTPKNENFEYFYLEEPNIPKDYFPMYLYGIYDRVTIDDTTLPRLKEDIVKILNDSNKFGVYNAEGKDKHFHWYTDKNFCPACSITYPDFTPQHFSSNRPEGACEKCHGLGETLQVDFDKIIDPYSNYLSAIIPWRDSKYGQNILEKLATKYAIDTAQRWSEIPGWFKDVVLNGDGELLRVNVGGSFVSVYYRGIEDVLTQQYHKGILTVDFQAMLDLRPCPECNGAKLKKESLSVYINMGEERFNIFDLQKLPIKQLKIVLEDFVVNAEKNKQLLSRILNPLLDRVGLISKLGMDYITDVRQVDTLSGGEIQRLRLAKQLGNKLTGIIYVLDEPTIGLDIKEILNTIDAIKQLKEMGNTIVVVEHNEEFIKNSDWVVEIGPGAGDFGGEVIFSGTYKSFIKSNCLTAKYIRGEELIDVKFTHRPTTNLLQVKKACKHNLQNIDVKIRLGSFTIITGASGAGKTTLMYSILYKFLEDKEKFIQSQIRLKMLKDGFTWNDIITAPIINRQDYEHNENIALQKFYEELCVQSILGYENVKNVLYVDQTSIGKTPRSCPATFIGVFDDIRNIYAGTDDSKMFGFSPGHFSFNSGKGACPECNGYGYKKIELQFLPDTYVPCELCKGKRYKPEVLSIKWRGKSIGEVLDMYVKDAYDFYDDVPFIQEKLEIMCDIGLGYLRMGQPAHTLSGGESQRLKLVKNLLKSYKGHTIYFLDEPTVGLHPQDIEKLLKILARFLDKGDTVLMIEHDKNLLQYADDIIRLDNGKLIKAK
ncbi:MAG: excinuclease ABC subunit UvrA [Candidatus Absconditabacteria bacterium]